MGNLLNVEGLAEDQNGHREELLEGLGDVDEVASLHTEQAQKGIAKALHRVARRVEFEESSPDDPTAPRGEDTEDEVKSHTGAVSHAGKDKSICGTTVSSVLDAVGDNTR